MLKQLFTGAIFCVMAASAEGQVVGIPTNGANGNRGGGGTWGPQGLTALDGMQQQALDFNIYLVNSNNPNGTRVESPSASISPLDLKSPGKAKKEYDRGFQLLMRKDLQAAIEHLTSATTIYPSFVAAHNALGTAYLNLGQNEQARDEFSKAVTLDDHLPNSYLNLGIAELALKDNPAAEEALRKASSIAPLDLQLSLAVAYGELANHDYPSVIATAQEVHQRKHKGAEVVHFFAAAAYAAQDDLTKAQDEMSTLLGENPTSPSAGQFRQVLEGMKTEEARRAEAKLHSPSAQPVTFSVVTPTAPTSEQASQQAQKILQDVKERSQIAEAEVSQDFTCDHCEGNAAATPAASGNGSSTAVARGVPGPIFRSSVDEVSVFFAATSHGKSVADLTASDVGVLDDSRAPEMIRGFRNMSQLPLRLGLIIDTSESITDRFSFEQAAAIKFLQKVVTKQEDQVFVVGVNNSVLLVQDFTSDPALTSRAVNRLAPGGGTALWDAVSFAADKLAKAEEEPVARILVVISDGEDNSSSVTLKEAIGSTLSREIAVYTVSTREAYSQDVTTMTYDPSSLGDHALRTLAELTGGATFVPGSVRRLNGSLDALQQVIRGRYMVSYKPAGFQRDGRFHRLEIKATKDGSRLKVYARKGYYASAEELAPSHP